MLALAAMIIAAPSVEALDYPTARLTARVVDEEGNAIAGADAEAYFVVAKMHEWGDTTIRKTGKSDDKGLFIVEGAGGPMVSVSASKDGFYSGGSGFEFKARSPRNRWEPWNPAINLVLRRRRNPVPMYAQYTDYILVPVFDQAVGYDLEKGDWVTPHGKGLVSDFVFKFHVERRSFSDYECSFILTFSNAHDGIQEYYFPPKEASYYKWPFEAPVDGYIPSLERHMAAKPHSSFVSNEKDGVNYIFRVRSKDDARGNIVDARYGKIRGELSLSPTGKISFSSYFNPDGTRNLEFDPNRNLFHWSYEDEGKHRLGEP